MPTSTNGRIVAVWLTLVMCVSFFPNVAQSITFTEYSDSSGFIYKGSGGGNSSVFVEDLFDNDGVYVADVNNDDWPDVLAIGDDRPVLFTNKKGTFHPEQLPGLSQKLAAAIFTDYNADGWVDIVAIPYEGTIALLENRRGDFVLDTKLNKPVLTSGIGGTAGDFNQDGCVDLFVIQYGQNPDKTPLRIKQERLGLKAENRETSSDNGDPNFLLHGDCESFLYKKRAGIDSDTHHWSLAASAADFNGDGWLDIHVANDFFKDVVYLNDPKGTFQRTYLDPETNRNGMSSQVTDVDNNGDPDILVSNIHFPKKSLFFDNTALTAKISSSFPGGHNFLVNRGNGQFVDKASEFGIKKGGWGWAVSSEDFDNDGTDEIYQTTLDLLDYKGFTSALDEIFSDVVPVDVGVSELRSMRGLSGFPNLYDLHRREYEYLDPRNVGFDVMDGRGVASLDFNRDGYMDLVVSEFQNSFSLLKNVSNSGQKNLNWIKVDTQGVADGGYIRIVLGDNQQIKRMNSRTDFMSQETPIRHFGINENEAIDKIVVHRNSGDSTILKDVEPNQIIRLNEWMN